MCVGVGGGVECGAVLGVLARHRADGAGATLGIVGREICNESSTDQPISSGPPRILHPPPSLSALPLVPQLLVLHLCHRLLLDRSDTQDTASRVLHLQMGLSALYHDCDLLRSGGSASAKEEDKDREQEQES